MRGWISGKVFDTYYGVVKKERREGGKVGMEKKYILYTRDQAPVKHILSETKPPPCSIHISQLVEQHCEWLR